MKLILILFTAILLNADMKITDYTVGNVDRVQKMYLVGVGNGLKWQERYTHKVKGIQVFCMPKESILNVNNYIQILDNEINKGIYPDSSYIELIMLVGFINTFPCK